MRDLVINRISKHPCRLLAYSNICCVRGKATYWKRLSCPCSYVDVVDVLSEDLVEELLGEGAQVCRRHRP
jgi:hypothetical protein